MLSSDDREALDLLNVGARSYEDSPSHAVDLWEKALTYGPSPDIEAIIRSKLAYALLYSFLDYEEGTAFTEEQGKRFLQGESHLIRLSNIIGNDEARQKLERLSPDNLANCQRILETHRLLSIRVGQGYYILPGDASVLRLVEYGYVVADSGEKEAAIPPLERAIALVEERHLDCRDFAFRAHLRLASLLNDTGRRSDAARHAQWVLDSGAANEKLTLMMEAVIASARKLGDSPPPSRDQGRKRTPLFFEGMSEILEDEPAGEIWLEVIDKEFDLLSKDYQLITLSRACDYLLTREEFEQADRWASRGLVIARDLPPDKSHAPFHTNLFNCIAKVAMKNKDFARAEQALLEAVNVPHAYTPHLYERLSVVCFASGSPRKGAHHLLQLVNHTDFRDTLTDRPGRIGDLFKVTFLDLKDGNLSKGEFLGPVLEAWKKTESMWSSIDPGDPKLSEIRHRAKQFQKSGCFIATACCTGPYSRWINDFVTLRESTLRRSVLGRRFIRWYEIYSPPIANFLANSPPLRKVALWLVIAPLRALTRLWLVINRIH